MNRLFAPVEGIMQFRYAMTDDFVRVPSNTPFAGKGVKLATTNRLLGGPVCLLRSASKMIIILTDIKITL